MLKSLFHSNILVSFGDFLISWYRTWFIMERDCVLMKRLNNITGVNFMINSTKLYAPGVTLSTNDNIKFLENMKQEFERTISWNKYISEITIQIKKTII